MIFDVILCVFKYTCDKKSDGCYVYSFEITLKVKGWVVSREIYTVTFDSEMFLDHFTLMRMTRDSILNETVSKG